MKFGASTHLLITLHAQSILGEVFWASRDGVGLVVTFDGTLGRYHYLMPLLWEGDGYRDSIEGTHVELLSLTELTPRSHEGTVRIWVHKRLSKPLRFLANGDEEIG